MMYRFYDLKNQVSIDEPRLARIAEYELRIEALTRTLAIWYALGLSQSLSTVTEVILRMQ